MRVNENVILAWQYYVEDSNGINKSKTQPSTGFTTFGATMNTYTIADGDIIIWRLVAINLKPNKPYYA